MRFEVETAQARPSVAAFVGALACLHVLLAPAPAQADGSRYACGSLPPGWTPPWERDKPAAPSPMDMGCHLMMACRRQTGEENS